MRFSPTQKNLAFFLFFFIAFGIYAVTKGQEVSYDFENYHYYNAFAFFHNRLNIDYVAADSQSYFNPLLDAFNYVLIQKFNDPKGLRFILGGIGGLCGFFLWKITHLLFPGSKQSQKIWLSILIGMTGTTVLSQIGSVMNDAQSALFVIIALFFIIKGFKHPPFENRYVLFAGLFLGIASALKLTNSLYFIAVFGAYMIYSLLEKKSFNLKGLLLLTLACAIGFILLDGWWAWRLYKAFGNPLFPYYNNFFHSPDFINSSLNDPRFVSHSFFDACYLPFKLMLRNKMLVTENMMRDGRLAALFILTALLVLKGIWALVLKKHVRISALWAFIFIFTFTSYFLWALQFGIYRYAIPFALMLGPCIVFLIDTIFQGKFTKGLILWLITILLLVTTLRPDFGHKQNYDARFLTVTAPTLLDNALVVIASPGESFLIPFLSSTAQFINPNFPNLKEDFIAQKRIEEHNGPFYILTNPGLGYTIPLPAFYAMYQFHLGDCQPIDTNMTSPGSFTLCQLLKD